MSHFTTAGELYAAGTLLPEFSPLDVTVTAGSGGTTGTQVTQTAPRQLSDGGVTYQFLFWDTGRQLTTRHVVRWTFNHAENWSNWAATAWYGIPGGGDGHPNEQFGAVWVGVGPLGGTPIDAGASSFANGPGGETAYPGDGNDHEVRTEWGSNRVETLDSMRRSTADPVLSFSGIQKIVYGGDPSEAPFDENDDNVPSGSSTVVGVVNTTANNLVLQPGESGLAVVGYVVPAPSRVVIPHVPVEQLIDLLHRIDVTVGDPSPEDRLRRALVDKALTLVGAGEVGKGDVFAGLHDAAHQMDKVQLAQAIAGTKATLARGEAALKTMQSLAAQDPQPAG